MDSNGSSTGLALRMTDGVTDGLAEIFYLSLLLASPPVMVPPSKSSRTYLAMEDRHVRYIERP